MAENKQKYDIPKEYQYQYKTDYTSDWDIHKNYIQSFDPYEAMLMGQVYDSVSNSIDGSKITDSYATTLAKERADRVIAKLPEGETTPTGKADVGKAAFMDILRQKWIYPNANAQHSFLEKLNMWQLYSSVYGYMPMFYDWNISPSGYVGPDCWLWSPRNLVPQQGRASINDMEYVTALTWVSKKYLEDILAGMDNTDSNDNKENDGGWDRDAVELLINVADQSSAPDIIQDSKVTRDRTPQSQKKGICLATRYEAGDDGEWCTFAPDHGFVEVRKIANPHKNGRIPFVIKYSQPLFDSFYGLGDFQRAMPLQFARDGLTNFYFKGIKMNLIPPIVANANGVLKHTLDYREGGVMLETIPNSIRRLETSSAGLATFQAAQSNLTGSLLSLYGSQNASIPGADSLNPSQGKTPQAINLYSDKEATRDGSERRHLEDSIQQLTTGFFTLVANIGTEEIPITLFHKDIEDIIKSGLTDVKDLFTNKNFKLNDSQTAGALKIDPKALKDIELRFQVTPDSTSKTNKAALLTALQDMMDRLGKYQNVIQDDPTIKINWSIILASYEELTGIPNASQFITVDPNAKPPAPPPSPTSIPMPSGVPIESSDLVKMYAAATNDPALQIALAQILGLPSHPQPQPTAAPPPSGPAIGQPGANITSTGHAFQDPHLAAAADALSQHAAFTSPPPPAQAQPAIPPTVAGSGHAFNDATIGAAANALHSIPTPPPKPEPKVPAKAPATNKK